MRVRRRGRQHSRELRGDSARAHRGGRAAASVDVPERDASLRQVVRGELQRNLVARDDADMVLAHLPGAVGDEVVPVVERHAKAGVRQDLDHHAFHFDDFFLGHVSCLRKIQKRKSPARAGLSDGATAGRYIHADRNPQSAERMFVACRPLGPVVTSKLTRWPSFSVLNPCSWIAEKWAKRSLPPSSGCLLYTSPSPRD